MKQLDAFAAVEDLPGLVRMIDHARADAVRIMVMARKRGRQEETIRAAQRILQTLKVVSEEIKEGQGE